MIVYGDPSFTATPARLAAALRESVEATTDIPLADRLRALLVLAGQAEQALADAGPDPCSAALTDRVADLWLRAGWGDRTPDDSDRLRSEISDLRFQIASDAPDALIAPPPLTIKVPEGFAFYALHPEQHAAAARRWSADHAAQKPGPVAVVGVRSIGTTLSAVVAATLRADGWAVRRSTVRPTGHPFARAATVDPADVAGAAFALVVDEGPGLSGSSMAAVGRAVVAAGVDPSRVAALPGHAGEPGAEASADVRAWWAATPRYVADPADLRWSGRSLADHLSAATERWAGGSAVVATHDLSGGAWRRFAFGSDVEWPMADAPFERHKLRCDLADGRSVLWKFCGLAAGPDGRTGAASAFARLSTVAESGWGPTPLPPTLGYVGVPWVEGRPLRREDATPAVLRQIGRYVVDLAGPPLSSGERRDAFDRLRRMLSWNAGLALGDNVRRAVDALADAAEPHALAWPGPRYGDGRLAPHEWRVAPAAPPPGRPTLWKLDADGHAADHTAVGPQPASWDVAGATVEWSPDGDDAPDLLDGYARAGTAPISPALLAFHRAAYAAFRLGVCAPCGPAADDAERARVASASARYCRELSRRLAAGAG